MLQELVPELELEVSPILAVRATRVFALAEPTLTTVRRERAGDSLVRGRKWSNSG
eukprot:CAMPEP_0119515918 /NCGR_PEP_ID=MMETSP1344-20130328/33256_1 /TAXON_ID=236787 /ORGANISM="Florenciella parvula, Strain CCMP2471" /LENGTH=54 /DNA_ID=CAMNT_0007553363 /DNA_START=195 /DNA_END=359 /DNA_ORIENTATION=-